MTLTFTNSKFFFSSMLGKIKPYVMFAKSLFVTFFTMMILMMWDTFSDYNMAYKHFRYSIFFIKKTPTFYEAILLQTFCK